MGNTALISKPFCPMLTSSPFLSLSHSATIWTVVRDASRCLNSWVWSHGLMSYIRPVCSLSVTNCRPLEPSIEKDEESDRIYVELNKHESQKTSTPGAGHFCGDLSGSATACVTRVPGNCSLVTETLQQRFTISLAKTPPVFRFNSLQTSFNCWCCTR